MSPKSKHKICVDRIKSARKVLLTQHGDPKTGVRRVEAYELELVGRDATGQNSYILLMQEDAVTHVLKIFNLRDSLIVSADLNSLSNFS